MARLSTALLTLALSAVAALGLAACGSGGEAELLPGDTASEITTNLDQVEQLAGEGDCTGAAGAAEAVSAQVEALNGVDAKLKEALSEGATRLNEVVAGCEEASAEEEEPAIETAEEPEETEKKEKPEKPEKPKDEETEEEAPEEETEPDLPPQANGKAKGHEEPEEQVPPPVEDGGTPSGGVGAGEPAGSGE
jgi:outer membrane biosynthesis protein TonB